MLRRQVLVQCIRNALYEMKTTVYCQVKKKENKLAKMNNTLAADTDLLRTTCGSSAIDSSRIVGIALCVALVSVCILIVLGNLMTIVLFAFNKRLHKKTVSAPKARVYPLF